MTPPPRAPPPLDTLGLCDDARALALAERLARELTFGRYLDHYTSCASLDADIRERRDGMRPPLGDTEPVLVVKTRVGGRNRAEHDDAIETLREHTRYLDDHDWEGDATYAYFYFHLRAVPGVEAVG